MSDPVCKFCRSKRWVKNGFVSGEQRYRCVTCGRNFTMKPNVKSETPQAKKSLAALLYGMGNASFRMIGRLLKTSVSSVSDWIYDQALAPPLPQPPAPGVDVVVVLDEMCHFVRKKKSKLWVWRAYDPLQKRICGWVLGQRDDKTLKKLVDFIGRKGRAFFTDDWDGYHRVLPQSQLCTGKDLTIGLESDNSNIRHYLARFRRRTKVVSRSARMVDISLRLLHGLQVQKHYEGIRDGFLETFDQPNPTLGFPSMLKNNL